MYHVVINMAVIFFPHNVDEFRVSMIGKRISLNLDISTDRAAIIS
jgi:hypothetical protein